MLVDTAGARSSPPPARSRAFNARFEAMLLAEIRGLLDELLAIAGVTVRGVSR